MIRGIGTDLLRIKRMEAAISRSEHFANRVFTEAERAYIYRGGKPNFASAAANFAAKEAVVKALGTGFRGLALTDVELLHDESGAPHIRLHNAALERAQGGKIWISLTHEGDYAAAYAVWEND